jgi:hypothetical protein
MSDTPFREFHLNAHLTGCIQVVVLHGARSGIQRGSIRKYPHILYMNI